jgi:hypothetical protein
MSEDNADNDPETKKNWWELRGAIQNGEVSTVEKLLIRHPELVHYRGDEYVSPRSDIPRDL